jgi:hypothetical protein
MVQPLQKREFLQRLPSTVLKAGSLVKITDDTASGRRLHVGLDRSNTVAEVLPASVLKREDPGVHDASDMIATVHIRGFDPAQSTSVQLRFTDTIALLREQISRCAHLA